MGAGLGNEKGISAPGYHIPAAGFINYDNIAYFITSENAASILVFF